MGITFTGRALRFASGLALIVVMAHADVFAREASTITAVEVQEADGTTRIILRGAQDAIYTAFMREDPPRLILELPNLHFEGVNTPINVDNGLVNDVTLGTFGDVQLGHSMARVSIGLARESEYEVVPHGDEIVVVLRPVSGAGSSATTASAKPDQNVAKKQNVTKSMDKPSAQPAARPQVPAAPSKEVDKLQPAATVEVPATPAPSLEPAKSKDQPDVVAPAVTPASSTKQEQTLPAAKAPMDQPNAKAATAASKIVGVAINDKGLDVKASGPVDNVDSFLLQNPDRLVVDFWGATSSVWPDRIDYELGTVSRVRVGEHADKVRVVLDLRTPLLSHEVVPGTAGVTVALKADARQAKDMSADARQVPAAPAPADAKTADAPAEPVAKTTGMPAGKDPVADKKLDTVEQDQVAKPIVPTGTADSLTAPKDMPEHTVMAKDAAVKPEPKAEAKPMAEPKAEAKPMAEPKAEAKPMAEPKAEAKPMAEPKAEAKPMAEPKAEAKPIAEPKAPAGAPTVESVHFESLPGVDRIVVSYSGDAAASIVEPDPATLIVMMPGAKIEKANERRVDTGEFGGPVKMFSVFKTPDIKSDEVRIVLHRADGKPAKLDWVDGQLYIEMQRDPSAADAAKPTAPTTATETAAPSQPAVAPTVEEAAAAKPAEPKPKAAKSRKSAKAARSKAKDATDSAMAESFDPFLDGPASPAAIDILEEGGFDEEKTYEGRRVSLDFKDADMGNILRLIAEVSDLNVIAGEEVSGRVTIRLVDVPWDQALDVILLTKGLGFVRIGNILRIAPVETLKVEREARLQERRAREKLEDLVVKLQPVNYAKAKDVSKLVKRLLSSRGSVNVDQRTNTLIIKDIPSVIHEATALVKAVDTQTPQVMIETKIVEASLNFSRGLGAIWGAGYKPLTSNGGAQDLHLADGTDASLIPGLANQASNFISSNPVAAATGLLTLGVLSLDDHLQLDLQLAAAEENRKGKVISSPRVVTLDNKEATIKQGVAIKFTETTQDKITVSFIDAVLQLKVTPHITANRSVIMKVKVSRNAPALSSATGDIVGIEKNETNTEAIVRDGETMVLGGIYVVDNGHSRTKVPFLADIPLLGTVFRSYSVQDERRELLVFVTPRVIHNAGADL